MAITISGSGITSANIADGTIVNADVNDVAASKLTGALPAIDGSSLTGVSGGKVLQVVSQKVTQEFTSSSNAWTDSSVTLSITPSATTSKVLVMITINGCITWNNDTYLQLKLSKGSTQLQVMEATGGETDSTAKSGYGTVAVNYLDSPATTSSVTYTVAGASVGNSSYVRFNADGAGSRAQSSITLMEIGA